MKKSLVILQIVFLILSITWGNGYGLVDASAPNSLPLYLEEAQQILEQMTPEEKVGQLFLVSFEGIDTSETTQIYDLISNHHVGGVILTSQNDNFIGPDNTLQEAYHLNEALQTVEWSSSELNTLDEENPGNGQYIPLFIGIEQNGDNSPNDQILSGLTSIPSQLAIGATWNTDLAKALGEISGTELHSLGFNLYLGPSLDLFDPIYAEKNNYLGNNTFGENPFWVGQMAQAFIEGLHTGSSNQLAVIAKYFPGIGSADRDHEIEVPTIGKSYEQILNSELAAFSYITGNVNLDEQITDGLLLPHVRYEGLQGNIMPSTRPVSLDTTALESIFAIDTYKNWYENGGLLISDNLGSESIKKFFESPSQVFDARQIANHALLAGNDLLWCDGLVATGDQDQYATIIRTLELFRQKYVEDPAFAQRVDNAVLRILCKKLSLYSSFELDNVIPPELDLNNFNQENDIVFSTAQQAATLLNPDSSVISSILPNTPGLSDRTVFITDVIPAKQCTDCSQEILIAADAFRKSIVRLYGPLASGQILQYQLISYSFNDLANYLNGIEEETIFEEDLLAADWIIFTFMDVDSERPASEALKRLLDEQPEILKNKYSVVFALNTPNYLDATDLSKVSAYYGLFSKLPDFIDIAARILFQEYLPEGNLPISYPAIDYDLSEILLPDPEQLIPLAIDLTHSDTENLEQEDNLDQGNFQSTSENGFLVGDTVSLMTGVIYDHNGNPVQDGTDVVFRIQYESETSTTNYIETETINGISQAQFIIESNGKIQISVAAGPAVNSEIVALDVDEGQVTIITDIPTQLQAEVEMLPTQTMTPPQPTATITPTPVENISHKAGFLNWLFVTLSLLLAAFLIYLVGRRIISTRWGIRWGFLVFIGGIIAYLFIAIQTPGNFPIIQSAGVFGWIILIGIGSALGGLIGYLWEIISTRNK